ncbi:AAA family ATPase [Teredinibacter turnerae]|uniref:AAA family ATPase n=1 Tax=Teredinibacter turnerae TaxID=2426 RepID=UPI0003F700CC|nr:ATP-binding protein [Teredinibacter turnerae]
MIKKLKLLFGENQSSASLLLDVAPVNIFVGPNNSGKSLLLKEIEQLCNNPEPGRKIISEIELDQYDKDSILAMLKSKETDKPEGHRHHGDHMFINRLNVLNSGQRVDQVNVHEIVNYVEGKNNNYDYFAQNFLSLYTIRLDGKTRFTLTEPRPSGDITKAPTNHLMAIFRDDSIRDKIRSITHDALDLHFVIDPTGMTEFKIKLSGDKPEDNTQEQGLDQRARDFHAAATDITDMSDGVKAFTGLIAASLSQDFKVLLIDEPEAFLHPTLARKLGKVLASITEERENTVFISTHSPDFVMGCVQSGQKINIVRLTYTNGVATARHLASEQLFKMMRNPLLRSTGILGAMFHESVIVSEADSDRAFYQEVNERLNQFGDDGAKDSLFINAQNKQTIGRIVAPLRNMGIPAAAIVDLDIIKKGGEFKELCKACNIPQSLIDSWGVLRGNLNKIFEDSGLNPNKNGVQDLPREHQDTLRMLLNNIAEYGIFAVPVGALEQWLPELEIPGKLHGPGWIMEAFEKMGESSSSPDYIKPTSDGVWAFFRGVSQWVSDPLRKGV